MFPFPNLLFLSFLILKFLLYLRSWISLPFLSGQIKLLFILLFRGYFWLPITLINYLINLFEFTDDLFDILVGLQLGISFSFEGFWWKWFYDVPSWDIHFDDVKCIDADILPIYRRINWMLIHQMFYLVQNLMKIGLKIMNIQSIGAI